MKKHLSLITLLLTLCMNVTALWADEVTYSPVLDVNFRTAAGNTAWNSGYPKSASDEGNTGFECNYNAGIFALQKYTVADLNNATKLVLTLTNGSGADAIRVWLFSTNDWDATSGVDDMVSAATTVVGVAPRSSEGTLNTTYLVQKGTKVSGTDHSTFTISGDALTRLKNAASSDGTFTLMLTDGSILSSSSRRFQSSNSANAEANRPTLVATIEQPAVVNKTTGETYSTLNAAFSGLTDADTELEVYEDQTLTGRCTWSNTNGHTLTITPKANITIKGHTNQMWFLVNKSNAVLNIGSDDYSITLDGENKTFGGYAVTKFENNAYLSLTNVKFKDFNLNGVGRLVEGNNNEGYITLKDITFSNCKNPETAFIKKLRVNNDKLILKGYLNIDSDCEGTTIYAASETQSGTVRGRIKIDDSGFTASNVITINWGGDKKEGAIAVIGSSAANADKFQLTDDEWELARNAGNGDLYMTKPVEPTAQIGSTSYADLTAALAAVKDGETITLLSDQEVTSRINVQNKSITIKGATGAEKITRATSYTNGLCFLTLTPGEGQSSSLTLEDVVIDGQNIEATAPLFEAANNGTTTLKNVTIQNAKNTNDSFTHAIIVNKAGGALVLDGVTFTNCSVVDGHGLVFVGTSNVTLRGNNVVSSIYIEQSLTITATDATHTTPINLLLESTRKAGTVVKGGTAARYTMSGGPDGYELTQNGSDVDLTEPIAPNVVNEETQTNYATLANALSAVADGETATLIINVAQEISSRVDIKNKIITLKGGTDGTIKRAASYTNGLCFLTVTPEEGYTSELTLDDVTIDGQNIEATAPVMEAANYGKTTLNNVTFLNCKDTKESSLDCSMISNKTGGTLVLNGVTMTGCSVPEGKGLIFVGTANVTLKGANTIASMYVENKYLLKVDDAATATSPITLLTDNGRAYGQITEGGNADIFTSSNYRMSQQMDGVYLMPAAVTKSYTHPGLLHTAADIARVKANLTLEPFKSAYAQLETTSGGTAAGAVEILKRMDQSNWSATYPDYGNFSRAATDAKLAYQLALRYQLKGSTAAATAAVNILNDWATHCKGVLRLKGYNNNIPDPNEYLLTIQAYQFANAAELLRSYNGWQTADFTKFQNWMRETYADLAVQFLENHHGNDNPLHYWLNWDLAALTAIYSVGVLCDDKTLVDYALNYTTNGEGNGNVMYANVATADDPDSNETLAQCQESGRDQGHATLDVTLLGALCQMAQNQGTDLFTPYKALEMAEYVAKYNLKNDAGEFAYTAADLPFTAYNNGEVNHTAISDEARGTLRPAWELFLAYAQNNGKEAHYCQQWSEWARRQNAYGEASTSSNDDLGYGTLMYMSADADDYSYTLAVGNAGAATLVLPFDATIPEDVKAYTLTVNGNSAVCTEVETTIPANTPVLVMADKGSYTFEGTSIWKSGTPTVGALTGVFSKTIVPATCYILTLADNQLAFRQADGATNTVEANRAYLSTGSANVKLLRVDFGSVDAIDATKTDQTDATLYDLSGRKMVKGKIPNGLYITGGKVIVKAK